MENTKHDRKLKILLGVCLAVAVTSAAAWALGWESFAFLILIAMAVATFHLFHFAMQWPLSKPGSPDASNTKPRRNHRDANHA